jgi:hypothetical protein
MRDSTRVRPEWTHVRNDTFPAPEGSVYQVELVESFRSPGHSSHYGPPVTANSAAEYGVRALVADLDGQAMFKVEGWSPRDSSKQCIEDRVLAEAGRRLVSADWSRGVVYVLSGF